MNELEQLKEHCRKMIKCSVPYISCIEVDLYMDREFDTTDWFEKLEKMTKETK